MSLNINKQIIGGRIAGEIESRQVGEQTVANFTIVTNSRRKVQGSDNEYEDVPEWHRVVAWGRLAERAATYAKGDEVYAEGTKLTRSYDKDGATQYITECKLTEFSLVRRKNAAGTFGEDAEENGGEPAPSGRAKPTFNTTKRPSARQPAAALFAGGKSSNVDDDSIPF